MNKKVLLWLVFSAFLITLFFNINKELVSNLYCVLSIGSFISVLVSMTLHQKQKSSVKKGLPLLICSLMFLLYFTIISLSMYIPNLSQFLGKEPSFIIVLLFLIQYYFILSYIDKDKKVK
ncbi:MAG: hypothetical protein RSB75_02300 [Anaerovoracaceae bacterium]